MDFKNGFTIPHRNVKAAACGDRICFMGGYCPVTEEAHETTNYEYDPQKDSWTAKANIPVGRSNSVIQHIDCARIWNKIHVIGGCDKEFKA